MCQYLFKASLSHNGFLVEIFVVIVDLIPLNPALSCLDHEYPLRLAILNLILDNIGIDAILPAEGDIRLQIARNLIDGSNYTIMVCFGIIENN